MDEANDFLDGTCLPAINARFARAPAMPEDAHVPLLDGTELRYIFCRQFVRVVSRDHIIQFERRLYRVPERLVPRPRHDEKVTVRKWLDGSVQVYWKAKPLLVEEFILPKPAKQEADALSA